jgi:hypothetical protein
MENKSFIIHSIKDIPMKGNLKTEPIPLEGASAWEKDSLYTEIQLNLDTSLKGFRSAVITQRWPIKVGSGDNERWIWHGETIEKMVVVKLFHAYYKRDTNKPFFISHVEKKIAKSAIKKLYVNFKNVFDLQEMVFDLRAIYNEISKGHIQNAKIIGGWIKRSDEKPIHSEAAFGDEVTNDDEFIAFADKGEFTNLKVGFNFNQEDLKASISKIGSLFFASDNSFENSIAFIEFIVERFSMS